MKTRLNSIEIKVKGVDKVKNFYYDRGTYKDLALQEFENLFLVSYKYLNGTREVRFPTCNVLSVDAIIEDIGDTK